MARRTSISFYVHLDEKNPHCHCTLVPVDAGRNRISWKSVFGDGREAESANMTALHSELLEQVNKKWGLERGSNMAETRARHRSTEEYKRELVSEVCDLETSRQELLRQIRRAEIKLKGISTMIAHLNERKQAIQDEIDQIARQFGQNGCDNAALASRMASLRKEMEDIEGKLSLRHKMLEDANQTILAARARLAELKQEHAQIRENLGTDFNHKTTELQKNLLATYNDMVAASWEPVRPTLTEQQRNVLDDSGFTHLTDNAAGVINCALLLASTASVRLPPMLSRMVAAPLTTPAGDGTRMRTMSDGGAAASPVSSHDEAKWKEKAKRTVIRVISVISYEQHQSLFCHDCH